MLVRVQVPSSLDRVSRILVEMCVVAAASWCRVCTGELVQWLHNSIAVLG